MRPCLSPLGEEISQDGLTLDFQHAAVHLSAPDNLAGRIQHHRTNRYVTSGCGLTGQFQCAAHRLVIFHTNECMPFLISSHDVHNRPQA